jgi:hypothetical protein
VLLDERKPAIDCIQAVAVVMLRLKNLFEKFGMPRQDLGMVILRRGDFRQTVEAFEKVYEQIAEVKEDVLRCRNRAAVAAYNS